MYHHRCRWILLFNYASDGKTYGFASKKDTAEMELISTKASIPRYDDLDKEIKEASKELKAIKAKFYDNLKKEDVDKIITKLAIDHYLEPTSLSITDVSEEEILNYKESLKAIEKKDENKNEDGTKEKHPQSV